MDITLNGAKYTIPDDSEYVAAEGFGHVFSYTSEPFLSSKFSTEKWDWDEYTTNLSFVCRIPPVADFTKCLAKVFDGAVIDFEGM